MHHHSHEVSSFPTTPMLGAAPPAGTGAGDPMANTRGPFVYFVPKEAICGKDSAWSKHMPAINIYQPSAPGRLIGMTKPLPPYLRESGIGELALFPLMSREQPKLTAFL